jgi:hypothetical protein
MRPLKTRARGQSTDGLAAMTQEAEAAAPETDTQAARPAPDLLGVAYLATMGIVMTAWVGGLIWAALAVIKWLMF